MFQRSIAILLLFVLAPLLIIISLCILIEGIISPRTRGPVFYSEKRYSKGEAFDIYKFRTVYTGVLNKQNHAEKDIKAIEHQKSNQTFIGHLIKKCYLDELPQIINIIKGDMVFVGPRPLMKTYYQMHIDAGNIAKGLMVAGWTGPWQSQKGHIVTLEDMVQVENEYYQRVKELGFFRRGVYDLGIIIRTFRIMIEAKSI